MKNRPGPSPVIVDCQARPRRSWTRVTLAAFAAIALSAASCGGDEGDSEGDGQPPAAPTAPTVLVTTGIWADVVSNVACGDLAIIETLIPVGGDPHGYEPSLRDRESMENAALVVANGLELEEGLEDTLEAVAEGGTPVFEFAEGMEPIPFAFEGAHHGEGEEEGHDEDEEESDHDEDEEEGDHDEDEEEGDHGEEEEGDHDDEEEGHDDDGGRRGRGRPRRGRRGPRQRRRSPRVVRSPARVGGAARARSRADR